MQSITEQQREAREARKAAKHYDSLQDFLEQTEADCLNAHVENDERWLGLLVDANGNMHVYAEFVFAGFLQGGKGWSLV